MFTCPRREQLTARRLHGMAACAHDLLSARKPPSLTIAIKQLIDAEIIERRVRSICQPAGDTYIAERPVSGASREGPHHKDFATVDYGPAASPKARPNRSGGKAPDGLAIRGWPARELCIAKIESKLNAENGSTLNDYQHLCRIIRETALASLIDDRYIGN